MASLRKRSGKWYFRGVVPIRLASGEIVHERRERCLDTQSRTRALKRASDLEQHFWEQAYRPQPKSGPPFSQAALTYIETRQKSDRFITRLIEHFGDTPLDEIDQQAATEAANKLYPGWKPSSLNRAIYTPLSAIGVRGLKRPPVVANRTPIPSEDWFKTVLSAAPPKLAALVAFVTITGRRVGEAIPLGPGDVDETGTITIGRTKNGTAIAVGLPPLCRDLLMDRNGYYRRKGVGQPSERLFGYASLQSASVALRRTCERAKVPYFSFHKCGRHSFASRCLRAGKSLKWIKEAGGWESMSSMFRYLHMEETEVTRERDEMGKEWGKQFLPGEETAETKDKAE